MRRPTTRGWGRAFTLVELLVVVSIIALLISILLPSLKQARQQAQAVVCSTSNKQIGTAIFTYQSEFGGYVPHNLWSEYDWGIYPSRAIKVQKQHLWFYKLFPKYAGDPRILICAGDPFRKKFDFEANFPNPTWPKHSNARVPSCGYGMNYRIRENGIDNPRSFNLEGYPSKRPAQTIMLAEVGPDDELVTQSNMFGVMFNKGQPWRDGGRVVYHSGQYGYSYSGPTWLTTRHMGGINVTATDGSVHRVRTNVPHLRDPLDLKPRYEDCTAGGCVFCIDSSSSQPHYNFAHAGMYWWVGPTPRYEPAEYVGQDSQL
jgi:prepilin-type N-terminal cleavage/methylation domain-containing protein